MAQPDFSGRRSYAVSNPSGEKFAITINGRVRWALEQLIKAGRNGCTPINNPAPRWSAYVFELRQLGVEIETIHEPHGGAFAGTHARYVLRSIVFQKAGKGEAA